MTGGQTALSLGAEDSQERRDGETASFRRLPASRAPLRVLRARPDEVAAHQQRIADLDRRAEDASVWTRMGLED